MLAAAAPAPVLPRHASLRSRFRFLAHALARLYFTILTIADIHADILFDYEISMISASRRSDTRGLMRER